MPVRIPAVIVLAVATLIQSFLWFYANVGDRGLRDGPLLRAGLSSPDRAHLAARLMMLDGDAAARRHGAELQQRLLELNAASPYEWLKTGVQLRATGEDAVGRDAIRRAVRLAPSSAPALMEAVHYYVAAGDRAEVLRLGSQVQSLGRTYDDFLFRYYAQLGVSTREILDSGIDGRRETLWAFLSYATEGRDLQQARAIWARVREMKAETPETLDAYTAFLVLEKQPAEAWAAWRDHFASLRPADEVSQGVFNPGFEYTPERGTFDWHWSEVPGAETSITNEAPQQGRLCLKVAFTGEVNVNYVHTGESVVAGPGSYELGAWVKSQGLTTNQGVALEASDGATMTAATEAVTGTTEWRQVTTRFRLPGQRLLRLRVARHPSVKFDNKIAGTFWMDNVWLRRVN